MKTSQSGANGRTRARPDGHEARRLMLFQKMDASDACYRVGYVSPSQFTRDYGRFFWSAPTKDVARLREEGFASRDADRS
jgi:AraC-like DNA-binding protein